MTDPTPRRRWFRFSLRTLFVVITVFAVWLGWNVHRVRQREALLEHLRRPSHQQAWFVDEVNPPSFGLMKWRLPVVWSLLGAKPVRIIRLNQTSEFDREQIQELFPEAEIIDES